MTRITLLADERLVHLDRKVDAAEGDGLHARWEFGRELLAERVGAKLPAGRLDEIAAAIGKSRGEVKRRVLFAERFPTRDLLDHAVIQYRSWHAVWSPHVSNNSGNNEWYTPPQFIEAARAVMGSIDLDPASSETAQQVVQAKSFYTAEDDGLVREWAGNVWLNPPYAAKLIGQFIDKVTTEDLDQACVLVNNGTETEWGQCLLEAASAVCFPRARIRFIDQDGNPSGAPLQGQMVAYLGNNRDDFAREFERFGLVLYR